jgi:hypothetical protein
MQWSDATKPPSTKMLRQFAGLCLVVFGGLAAWRAWHADTGALTMALAAGAVLIGITGLIVPAAVRPVFTAWMIAAFPIGWTISRVALALAFAVMFVPVGLYFRLSGRDALRLKRGTQPSYWLPKPGARSPEDYLRQF